MEEEFRAWLARGLNKPGKSQAGLARHLGISQSAGNRLVRGRTKLKAEDLSRIAAYLEEPLFSFVVPSGFEIAQTTATALHAVPLLGLVLDGIWIEAPVHSEASVAIVPHPDYPLDAHYALEGTRQSTDDVDVDRKIFVCVKIDAVGRKLRPRDRVHLRVPMERGGSKQQWQIRTVALRGGALVLVPTGLAKAGDEIPLVPEQIMGLVVGLMTHFRS